MTEGLALLAVDDERPALEDLVRNDVERAAFVFDEVLIDRAPEKR